MPYWFKRMLKQKVITLVLVLAVGWTGGFLQNSLQNRRQSVTLEREVSALKADNESMSLERELVRKVFCKITAYSSDAISINRPQWLEDGATASGLMARRGRVAADWDYFPPGTRLYVPGYGEAVVADRGSDVQGNHIDLYMDSYDEAKRWGVRNVEVYVIEMGKPLTKDASTTVASPRKG